MASLNKVILIGNLGKDPEVRYLPNGEAVANFSIATTEKWKGQDGQMVEKTEWHNIQMYKRLAEIAGQYLKKGSQIYIEGRIQTRKWQDKQTGADRYTTEIIANEMKMLGGRTESQGSPAYSAPTKSNASNPASDDWGTPVARAAAPTPNRPAARPPTDVFDDDIPF